MGMEFDLEKLASSIDAGDQSARDRAFGHYRSRLKKMVLAFLDPRLKARIDPSDVVQDAFIKATVKLPEYLNERPLDFYPWLRAIVREEIIDVHRRHVTAQCRSINREHQSRHLLTDASAVQLAERFVANQTSPSRHASGQELQHKMQNALMELANNDREILLMRFIEGLSVDEIAEILMISKGAATSRLRRALERLGQQLL